MSKERPRTTEQNQEHLAELEEFKKKGIKPEILLIGTSMFRRMVFVKSAMKMYREHELDKYNILNLGAGGDKIANILWRLEDANGGILEAIKQYHTPKLIILMAGENDIETVTHRKMCKQIEMVVNAIYVKFPPPVTKLVVFGMLPRLSEIQKTERIMELYSEFNNTIKYLPYLSRYVHFDDKILNDQYLPNRELFVDNVHLNEKGYDIMCSKLREIIVEFYVPTVKKKSSTRISVIEREQEKKSTEKQEEFIFDGTDFPPLT